MAFQASVNNIGLAFGVPGEFFDDSPRRAQPGWLDSASAANNVFGRAFTVKDDATGNFVTSKDPQPLIVQAGGTGVFAGIMVHPKEHAANGTAADGPLAPTLTIPNNRIAAFATMGRVIVPVAAAVAVGDVAEFVNTTGVISFRAPSGTVPAGSTRIVGSQVYHYEAGPTGLAVVELGGILTLQPGA